MPKYEKGDVIKLITYDKVTPNLIDIFRFKISSILYFSNEKFIDFYKKNLSGITLEILRTDTTIGGNKRYVVNCIQGMWDIQERSVYEGFIDVFKCQYPKIKLDKKLFVL